jgi:hypothetical protein
MPYAKSYAVIIAIDDYDRKHSNGELKPTGYPELSFMVANGQSLAKTLETVGFDRTNIFELYDEKATSDSIERLLKRF